MSNKSLITKIDPILTVDFLTALRDQVIKEMKSLKTSGNNISESVAWDHMSGTTMFMMSFLKHCNELSYKKIYEEYTSMDFDDALEVDDYIINKMKARNIV